MKRVLWWICVLAGVYAVFVGVLFLAQRSMIYHPSQEPLRAAEVGLPADALVETRTEDYLTLSHFYVPPGDPEAPVVVVFHGNAGNASHRLAKFSSLVAGGYGLFLAEYRGYGGNPGKPTEAGLIADGESVLDWLESQGIGEARVALYGESLGTGVVLALARERRLRAIVLEAPFTSIAAAAQQRYPFVPAKWLVLDRFDNLTRIASIEAPILILHGEQDRVMPSSHGRRLAEAGRRVSLQLFPAAGHNDLFEQGAGEKVLDFLGQVYAR
ncbi:MAG: alpha/beta hydrolase [Rhodovibrionaceae bacterium]